MRHLGTATLLLPFILVGSATGADVPAHVDHPPARSELEAAIQERIGSAPLRFERNEGQTAAEVSFLARGEGYTLFVTSDAAVFVLAGTAGAERSVVRMTFSGADPEAVAVGREPLAGRVSYFRGQDPEQWVQDAPTFARLECAEVYPGVDLVYRGAGTQLAYDFVVAPGADPEVIRLAFEGVTALELDAEGALVLSSAHGSYVHRAPVIYQEEAGRRQPVAGRFVLRGEREVGFEVSGFDPTRPLVIDPDVTAASLVGGSGDDWVNGVAVDGAGNIYLAGNTDAVDFPPNGGTLRGDQDAFVAKLDPAGTPIECIYIGGDGDENAADVKLDSVGGIVVTGTTNSSAPPPSVPFPVLNAHQPEYGGGSHDAFVARFHADGAPDFSTYLGGLGDDQALDLAIGPLDRIYLTGKTSSGGLATPGAFAEDQNGGSPYAYYDGYLATLSASGALEYFSYLGGAWNDTGLHIAVASDGHAYITGHTMNDIDHPPAFPTTADAYRPSIPTANNNSLESIFISRLNPAGQGTTDLVYSTFLLRDRGAQKAGAIAADDHGRAYLVGQVGPAQNLPTTAGAFDESYNGGKFYKYPDAFVVVLDTGEVGDDSLVYGSYLGGYHTEFANAIEVSGASEDTLGDIYVAGTVAHDDNFIHPKDRTVIPFPVTDDALLLEIVAGWSEGFVTHLRPASAGAADLIFSTLVGGIGGDHCRDLALGSAGRVVVIGGTDDFTSFTPELNTTHAGGQADIFVLGLDFGTVTDPPAAPSGLLATAISDSRIDLEWTDNSDNEGGFEIQSKFGTEEWTLRATPGANATTYPDTGLTAATDYFYRVRAVNAVGESVYSDIAWATTLPPGVPPSAPSDLVATADSSSEIGLAWVDTSGDEDGFQIDRSPDGSSWGPLVTLGADVTSHPDTGLAAETTYYYRVSAFNSAGDSDYSNVGFATTLASSGGGGDFTATGEISVAGTITVGSYLDTQASDGDLEAISEQETTTNPAKRRYSYLEHKWTFDIPAGSSAETLSLEAYRPGSSDGDDFQFAWSTDDSNYTDMFEVTKTSDDDVPQEFEFPAGVTGPVFIRVLDTDRTAGNRELNTLYVDHLFIRAVD